MGTFIVGAIVLIAVALAVFSMVRDKKNGKSLQCGVNCGKCGGHCGGCKATEYAERRD